MQISLRKTQHASVLVHCMLCLLAGSLNAGTGLSTLTIFTRGARFFEMLRTLTSTAKASWPALLGLANVTCIYALMARDIFEGRVNVPLQPHYTFMLYVAACR